MISVLDTEDRIRNDSDQRQVYVVVPMKDDLWGVTAERVLQIAIANRGILRHLMGSPVAENRNAAAGEFMKTGCEWMLTVDSDVGPPVESLAMLLETAKAKKAYMVSACVPIIMDDHLCSGLIGRDEGGQWYYDEFRREVIEVDSCGFGCVLIHRKVFQCLSEPWFYWGVKADGQLIGEDIGFCRRAKEKGFKIWGDSRVICSHKKTFDYAKLREVIDREATHLKEMREAEHAEAPGRHHW